MMRIYRPKRLHVTKYRGNHWALLYLERASGPSTGPALAFGVGRRRWAVGYTRKPQHPPGARIKGKVLLDLLHRP